jgi:hypothetical protein
MRIASDDILGWVAATGITAGVVKYGRDYFMIGRPKRNVPSPRKDPELIASRERVLAAMRAAGVTPRSDLVKERTGLAAFLFGRRCAKPPSVTPR